MFTENLLHARCWSKWHTYWVMKLSGVMKCKEKLNKPCLSHSLVSGGDGMSPSLALEPLFLTPLFNCHSVVTINYFYISFLKMIYCPYLTLPKKIKLDNMFCLYVFHLIYKLNLILVWVYLRLHVYEWVYVKADSQRRWLFCEPQIELASVRLYSLLCFSLGYQ